MCNYVIVLNTSNTSNMYKYKSWLLHVLIVQVYVVKINENLLLVNYLLFSSYNTFFKAEVKFKLKCKTEVQMV